MSTKIEWTNETWNPTSGCTYISEACDNCYAEKFSRRLQSILASANPEKSYKYKYGFKPTCYPGELTTPDKWKTPKKIFVTSMGDLFHPDIPFDFIDAVFSVMADINRHTYIVLTKRPQRMVMFMNWKREQFGVRWIPSQNIWFGTTIEMQKYAKDRIFYLLQMPSPVHLISYEPALGPLNITPYLPYDELDARLKINWVICGGESGTGSRPMNPDWVRSIRDQCNNAGVPFFFKSWGDYFPGYDNKEMIKVGKKYSGRLLDSCEYNEFPII